MAKGFWTQGMAVLLKCAVELDDLEALLAGFKVLKRDNDGAEWTMSGPSLLVEYRPDVNGLVTVDVVNRVWPDHMGHPKTKPEVFAAWSMGFFGPLTFPGNLERAIQMAHSWATAGEAVEQHTAFIRIRVSYCRGPLWHKKRRTRISGAPLGF